MTPCHLSLPIAPSLPQTQLSCAAQHIFWSSIYGGVLGDNGRYDAFEMVMEILRVKLLYPDLDPKQYAEKDEAFRRFVHCEGGKGKRYVRRRLADGSRCHGHLFTPSLPRPMHSNPVLKNALTPLRRPGRGGGAAPSPCRLRALQLQQFQQ